MATEISFPFDQQGGVDQETAEGHGRLLWSMLGRAQGTDSGVDDLGWYGVDDVLTPGRVGASPDALDSAREATGMLNIVADDVGGIPARALVCGFAYELSSGPLTLTPSANSSGSAGDRYDTAVLQLNRSGSATAEGTPTGSIACVLKEGVPASTPARPALSQDPETVFEMPLCTWRMKKGNGVYDTDDQVSDDRWFLRYHPADVEYASTLTDGGNPDVYNDRTLLQCRLYVSRLGAVEWTVGTAALVSTVSGRAILAWRLFRGGTTGGELVLDAVPKRSVRSQNTAGATANGEDVSRSGVHRGLTPGLYTAIGSTRNGGAGTAYFNNSYLVMRPLP